MLPRPDFYLMCEFYVRIYHLLYYPFRKERLFSETSFIFGQSNPLGAHFCSRDILNRGVIPRLTTLQTGGNL